MRGYRFHLYAKSLNYSRAPSPTMYMCFHMTSSLFFHFSPALLPEHCCPSHSVWLGFLKLPKQFNVLGSSREWPHSSFYINLLKEYKGHITLHHQCLTKLFMRIILSIFIQSSLSLRNTQTEKGWESGTLPRVPFISTLQMLNFFWYRAKLVYLTLPRVIPNRLCQQSPWKRLSYTNPCCRHDWAAGVEWQ